MYNLINFQEFQETKLILDEVLERVQDIDYRKNQQQQLLSKEKTTTNNNNIQYDVGPPPDDYRLLPIVPGVTEILSEQQTYLRKNIVDGVYEDPQQYLDVNTHLDFYHSISFQFFKIHFRLLREDFVGPLRDGIQQYRSGAEGKNFNVRVYENVHSLGPRLSPRNGIVYDLCLDPQMASKFSWANSRRLIYGNLLVLTYDNFQSCTFATVEDRTQIEKDFIISVNLLV